MADCWLVFKEPGRGADRLGIPIPAWESSRYLWLKPAQIIIQPSDGPSRVHPITAEETLIGRSMHSDIKLTDTGISREHATITWEGEVYVLEDLQSTNGTKLNDKRIRSAELKSGDEIQVGRTVLTFQLSE